MHLLLIIKQASRCFEERLHGFFSRRHAHFVFSLTQIAKLNSTRLRIFPMCHYVFPCFKPQAKHSGRIPWSVLVRRGPEFCGAPKGPPIPIRANSDKGRNGFLTMGTLGLTNQAFSASNSQGLRWEESWFDLSAEETGLGVSCALPGFFVAFVFGGAPKGTSPMPGSRPIHKEVKLRMSNGQKKKEGEEF